MINDVVSSILGGLGLLFIALKFLEINVRGLSTNAVKAIIAKHTSNVYLLPLWGCLLGLVTGSPIVVGSIAACLYSCQAVTIKQAHLMTCWSNLGCWGLYFLAFINIDLLVLYLLALTGVAAYLEKPFQWRYYMGSLAAIALMMFSVTIMKSNSGKLMELPMISQHLQTIQSSYFEGFLIAAILTVITQSDLVVMLLTANFTQAGVLTVDQAILMLYGIQLGVGLSYLLIAINVRGALKQVAIMQIFLNTFLACFFSSLLMIEITFNVPLMKALSTFVASSIWTQMLFIIVLTTGLTCIVFSLLINPLCRLLNRWIPLGEPREEEIPGYLIPSAPFDQKSVVIEMLAKENEELKFRLRNFVDRA